MVDTRLLGKRERWNGEDKGWRDWRGGSGRTYLIAALFSISELLERAPNGRTNDLIPFSLAHVGINFSNCVFVQKSPNTRTQSVKTSFVQLHAEEVSLPHGRKPGEMRHNFW